MAESTILPTRSSGETVASADINSLSSQALDKQGTEQLSNMTVVTTSTSGDKFLIELSTGEIRYIDNDNMPAGGGGDALDDFRIDRPAGTFDYPASNPAPLDTDSGTNGTIKRHLMDDTTEEFVISKFQVPHNLDTSGTVTFEAYGYATTADGNEIQLRFGHSAGGDSDTWDLAFTDEDSGDLTTDGTQDDLDHFTWTETVSNLGWSANDQVRFQVSRVAIDDGTPLSGDWGLTHFRIRIPRT